MATWHQQRNPGALRALWAPHPTKWKVVEDPCNEFASCMSFERRDDANAYQKRAGGHLVPPLTERRP